MPLRTAGQASVDVSTIQNIYTNAFVSAFVDFVQFPFCGKMIQMCGALANDRGAATRHKQFQALDDEFPRVSCSASVEPQDAKGQRGDDGRPQFLSVDTQNREG